MVEPYDADVALFNPGWVLEPFKVAEDRRTCYGEGCGPYPGTARRERYRARWHRRRNGSPMLEFVLADPRHGPVWIAQNESRPSRPDPFMDTSPFGDAVAGQDFIEFGQFHLDAEGYDLSSAREKWRMRERS